jgi:hypothetical protein
MAGCLDRLWRRCITCTYPLRATFWTVEAWIVLQYTKTIFSGKDSRINQRVVAQSNSFLSSSYTQITWMLKHFQDATAHLILRYHWLNSTSISEGSYQNTVELQYRPNYGCVKSIWSHMNARRNNNVSKSPYDPGMSYPKCPWTKLSHPIA